LYYSKRALLRRAFVRRAIEGFISQGLVVKSNLKELSHTYFIIAMYMIAGCNQREILGSIFTNKCDEHNQFFELISV